MQADGNSGDGETAVFASDAAQFATDYGDIGARQRLARGGIDDAAADGADANGSLRDHHRGEEGLHRDGRGENQAHVSSGFR